MTSFTIGYEAQIGRNEIHLAWIGKFWWKNDLSMDPAVVGNWNNSCSIENSSRGGTVRSTQIVDPVPNDIVHFKIINQMKALCFKYKETMMKA